jgi:hypothetical protein
MKPIFLKDLMKIEKEMIIDELCGMRNISIDNATPRVVDVFTLITRFVSMNDHNAYVQHRRVHLDFIGGSLNAATQCGAIQKGMQFVHLNHSDITSISMDGCSTNE